MKCLLSEAQNECCAAVWAVLQRGSQYFQSLFVVQFRNSFLKTWTYRILKWWNPVGMQQVINTRRSSVVGMVCSVIYEEVVTVIHDVFAFLRKRGSTECFWGCLGAEQSTTKGLSWGFLTEDRVLGTIAAWFPDLKLSQQVQWKLKAALQAQWWNMCNFYTVLV